MNRLGFRVGMTTGRLMRGPVSVLAWAAAAGAAGLVSLWLGFTVLVLLFLVTGLRQQAGTAKAASTEARVNALVPAVGAVKDTADYASGRADTAYTNAGNAQSTANSAQGTANTANSTANSAYNLANSAVQGGDYWSGTFRADAVHAAGDIQADGTLYGGSLSGNWSGGYGHSSGNFQADGQINCNSISISAMGAVAHPDANVASLKQAVDGILNRL